jgi:hypothetical protein
MYGKIADRLLGFDDIHAKVEGQLRSLWKPLPLKHARVQLWMRHCYQHFKHCHNDPKLEEHGKPALLIYPVPAYKLRHFADDPRFSAEWRTLEHKKIDLENREITERAAAGHARAAQGGGVDSPLQSRLSPGLRADRAAAHGVDCTLVRSRGGAARRMMTGRSRPSLTTSALMKPTPRPARGGMLRVRTPVTLVMRQRHHDRPNLACHQLIGISFDLDRHLRY